MRSEDSTVTWRHLQSPFITRNTGQFQHKHVDEKNRTVGVLNVVDQLISIGNCFDGSTKRHRPIPLPLGILVRRKKSSSFRQLKQDDVLLSTNLSFSFQNHVFLLFALEKFDSFFFPFIKSNRPWGIPVQVKLMLLITSLTSFHDHNHAIKTVAASRFMS